MAKTINFNEAKSEVKKFFDEEITYTDLMEQTARAQAEFINILHVLDKLPDHERPQFGAINDFFYYITTAVRLLKNFE